MIQTISTPEPEPLSQLPKNIHEIMDKGRNQVNGPFVVSLVVFFLVGVIAMLVDEARLDYDIPYVMPLCVLLGFLSGLILGMIMTYKWQKWARRSGLPEEELKAAAKLAGLWWPNTMRDEF